MKNQDLNKRFPSLRIDTEQAISKVRYVKEGAGVELYLQGAHVTRFDAARGGSPLFISRESGFEVGKAIRGGIPICFPWFGPNKENPKLPSHGFARTSEWQVESDGNELVLSLKSNEQTLALWPHAFKANYRVGVDANHLRVALEVHNIGDTPFTFEAALHTYFRVSDARIVSVEGLVGKTYMDQLEAMARKVQKGPIYFEGEVDRIYLDSPGPVTLSDESRSVRVSNLGGWRSTVVWNPWIEKARAMKDLADDEWTQFVCIESGVIADDAVTVPPGDFYTLAIEIEAESSH
ncbi:D-hexose-6-phosphate mutarotase [bacterium]|nr:MAG: D-hexose-6-phosphate mutarotase [bacterium]